MFRVVLAGLALGAAGPLAAQSAGWGTRLELRIGSADGDHDALSRVSDVAVGRDGSIYVALPQERVVRVFSAAGRFVRDIGRGGDGPGDFRSPDKLGWKGDSLWVSDHQLTRTSLFDRGGRFGSSCTFVWSSRSRIPLTYIPWQLLADGSVLGGKVRVPQPYSESSPVLLAEVRFTRSGRPIDTVAVLAATHAGLVVERGRAPPIIAAQPFRDDPLLAVSPDGSGIVIVNRDAATRRVGDAFVVTRLGPAGDTVFTRVYRYTARPLPVSEVATTLEDLARGMRRVSRDRDLSTRIRRAMYVPRFRTPIEEVVAGRDGTIWLRRESSGLTARRWTVLDARGNLLRTVEVPVGTRVLQAEAGRLWGVQEDADGIPYVVRLRVVPRTRIPQRAP